MLLQRELQKIQQTIETGEDEKALTMFQALSDPGRLHIFRLLASHEDLCVTDVAHVLNTSVPAASRQLRILEMSGIAKRSRHGQAICYQLRKRDKKIRELLRLVVNN